MLAPPAPADPRSPNAVRAPSVWPDELQLAVEFWPEDFSLSLPFAVDGDRDSGLDLPLRL